MATPIPDVSPELPPRTWRAILAALGRVPQGAVSRLAGMAADTPIPRSLRRTVLGGFARAVGIDVSEAELPIDEYPTLNRFFVRRLRPGARDWPGDHSILASPVEGIVGQLGTIRDGTLIQAKGRSYSAASLLGDADEAERYDGGVFITIYLSPRHYHRIHSPCDGTVPLARHLPGGLFPVNAAAVAHIDELFARNERLLCYLDGPLGRVALVAIGAYNVGRISAAFDADWGDPAAERSVTNRRGRTTPETRSYDPQPRLEQGDELMAFHLGSTIVMLLERNSLNLDPRIQPGGDVRLGAPLGGRP